MAEKARQNIEDIAQICRVSKSTVSRALNNSPLISAETKDRIREVAREHNFQMNVAARQLSTQRSRTIALAVQGGHSTLQTCFSISELFTLEILGAITSTLSALNYDLLVANINPSDKKWPHKYLDTGRVDGFILLTSTHKRMHIRELAEMNAPFIVWGVPVENYNYCSVIGDNFRGGQLATQHLIQTGKRRIAFIGGPADEFESQRRYEGYGTTLRQNGLEVDPALVCYGEWTDDSGAEMTRQLVDSGVKFDAIFANSDLMAAAAINVLMNERGLRVPQDVAVVGYDDLSIARFCSPSLTTVSQNLPLVGRLLAQNLIQRIETGVITNVTIPAELMVRNSTGS
jgi:DNA-binding LacI/PurR family transcriptional regulator